ncbi:MAG: division/cell wall cluster transcriptional repressor MraZ, partial [Firmicutes bacterium]|nr:division/cell wall cluster transcriptional repressor MraZ [Bacillota bacterium]
KQGRVKIPQDLLDYAGIDKELITIGSNSKIEIWSREQWMAQLDEESGELLNASEVAEGLEQYGF